MPQTTESPFHKETLRLETFSDGVFCIAITLLSIEIGVELHGDTSNETLTRALLAKWPLYLAYVTSFINILLAWIGHHSLFKLLRRTDNAVMISNGLLLMLVALVPFPTKTLGEFLQTGAFSAAVIFYTGYFVLISLAFRLLWFSACSHKENLVSGITPEKIKQTTRMENTGLFCNSLILGVAFLSPWMALVLSFCMWVYWMAFS